MYSLFLLSVLSELTKQVIRVISNLIQWEFGLRWHLI